ncbi:MAG: hypothetical protein PHQ34_04985, partial [Methanothrix sp.]|nr:hypothetical protein [Methanothrix sp.]
MVHRGASALSLAASAGQGVITIGKSVPAIMQNLALRYFLWVRDKIYHSHASNKFMCQSLKKNCSRWLLVLKNLGA